MSLNNNRPILLLGAEPSKTFVIPKFFYGKNNPFFNTLQNPPYLRYSGWNMLTLDTPKIIEGTGWEVRNGEIKTIRLFNDGVCVVGADANENFLGWGQEREQFLENPRLNTLAVVEFVYEFVNFYKQLLKFMPPTDSVKFIISLNGVKVNEKNLRLEPVEVGDPFYNSNVHGKHHIKEDFSSVVSVKTTNNTYNSEEVAYLLLTELFIRFNITQDQIPYTVSPETGNGYIDIEKIKK